MTDEARILLVEDDRRTAMAIAAILAGAGFASPAMAHDVASARAQFAAATFDGVMVDLGLPDADGVDFIRDLRARDAELPVLVITSVASPERVVTAMRAGADGFLFKDDIDVRLGTALRDVIAGGAPLSTAAAKALLAEIRAPGPPSCGPKLTARQTQVLEQLATGAGYAEIARALNIGINTVRTHVVSLYEQLGVENRAEAIDLAWRWGLLDPRRRV